MNYSLAKAAVRSASVFLACVMSVAAQAPGQAPTQSSGEPANEWRTLDLENTLYMEVDAGRIVIELAPQFAPSMSNIKTLVREKLRCTANQPCAG
jgi:peptidylprolyl isomerase